MIVDDGEGEQIARESEDVRLQIVHARDMLRDIEKQRRGARRQYARDYYAVHREEYLEYQRQRRAEQRANDPDGFRARARERNQRWRDSHKDEVNAKIRAKYHADPEKLRERRREYYATHAEEQRARRREYYARNKEKQNANHRAWLDREKRRRSAGLPPNRLHRTRRDDRMANNAAADEFFARTWSEAELAEAMKSIATPPELLAAFKRDCLSARATYRLAEQKGRARTAAEGTRPRPPRTQAETATDSGGDGGGAAARADWPAGQRAPPTSRSAAPRAPP